jgi:hypothetical protein
MGNQPSRHDISHHRQGGGSHTDSGGTSSHAAGRSSRTHGQLSEAHRRPTGQSMNRPASVSAFPISAVKPVRHNPEATITIPQSTYEEGGRDFVRDDMSAIYEVNEVYQSDHKVMKAAYSYSTKANPDDLLFKVGERILIIGMYVPSRSRMYNGHLNLIDSASNLNLVVNSGVMSESVNVPDFPVQTK